MPLLTKTKSAAPAQSKGRPRIWGDMGVSEREFMQDTSLAVTPQQQSVILADAGILSELQHHVSASNLTVTHGTGTNAKDVFGPYDLVQWYQFTSGSNTPLHSYSGRMQGILQIIEYPGRSFEADADPASVIDPLTNTSDFFNFPAATGQFRYWVKVPIALRLNGVPGGHVGYITLQNKKIANIVKPIFNVSGAAAPYSVAGASAGSAPYIVTGNDTVTASPNFETWKTLQTVPVGGRSQMPVFGYLRYITEVQQALTGSSSTYSFEPGGSLLRAIFQLYDATAARGIATANVNQMTYQYGTNKQVEVYTPYRNLNRQLEIYGRTLPQGCYAFDYYTQERSLVNVKSTENTANVQVVFSFAQGYTPPNGSMLYGLLDKLYVAQNYLAK